MGQNTGGAGCAVEGRNLCGGRAAGERQQAEITPARAALPLDGGGGAVFLEADGAKRLPCKAPAGHEPVLLPESDIVLAVAGLSAVGQPLQKVCFRLGTACVLLGTTPDTPLTPHLLAKLLADRVGGRKNVNDRPFFAVLNQADTPQRRAYGEETQKILQTQYAVRSILTAFEEGERG